MVAFSLRKEVLKQMQNKERKSKHLTLDDRIEIQECLAKGMTFKAIGKRIGKNQTTVSREVKLHLQSYTSGHTYSKDIAQAIGIAEIHPKDVMQSPKLLSLFSHS